MTHFRDLFLLRDDVVFLNHGSFGACPRPVFEKYGAWQLELERQPVEFLGRRFEDLMRETREALGTFIGADPANLVYVPNATTGVNIVARSLPLQPGDEVLATDHEYGAVDFTWRFVCGKRGARYIRQPVTLPVASQDEIADAVWSGVTEKTRVLFFSHITSPTAVQFPAAELVRRARAAGIIAVVDGAHAPGQIALDIESLGADFYTGNCHKWLMAPKGAGFLHARPKVQQILEPLVVSWGWEKDKPGPSRLVDAHEWQGTRDIAAYLSVPAAISFHEENDWAAVRDGCRELVLYARERAAAITGLEPVTPDGPEWFVQMGILPLPACDSESLQRRLHDEHRIEIPIIEWKGRQFARISIQGYNTREDVDALIDALVKLF